VFDWFEYPITWKFSLSKWIPYFFLTKLYFQIYSYVSTDKDWIQIRRRSKGLVLTRRTFFLIESKFFSPVFEGAGVRIHLYAYETSALLTLFATLTCVGKNKMFFRWKPMWFFFARLIFQDFLLFCIYIYILFHDELHSIKHDIYILWKFWKK